MIETIWELLGTPPSVLRVLRFLWALAWASLFVTSESAGQHSANRHSASHTLLIRVPAGSLALGSTLDEIVEAAAACNRAAGRLACRVEDFWSERRDQTVHVPTFGLDRTEVSVAAYQRCVRAGRCAPHRMSASLLDGPRPDELPVTTITQADAADYCAFRGARLPSEDEWELAARGPNRRVYPWGNVFHARRVNGGDGPPRLTSDRDGHELLAPTGAFPSGATPLGILQLSGNAAEWTASAETDAAGTKTGRVLVRGGHFASPPWDLRAARREAVDPGERHSTIGFRCALTLDPG